MDAATSEKMKRVEWKFAWRECGHSMNGRLLGKRIFEQAETFSVRGPGPHLPQNSAAEKRNGRA
jgi:hypothetical protein